MVSRFCKIALLLSVVLPFYVLDVASSTTLAGPNVCTVRVSSKVSRKTSSKKQYTVKYKTSCWYRTISFPCTVTRVRYRTVYTTTYHATYSNRRSCCSGYTAVGGKCQPVCSPTCKNGGTCTRPGHCHCRSGWTGSSCTIPECDPGCTTNSGTCVAPFNCLCPAGMSGPACLTACSGNRFGQNCAKICKCKNGASCDPVLGTCSCTAGWKGKNCGHPCPSGTYGIGCRKCSCNNGAACDRVSGKCICSPGYYGTSCEHRCSDCQCQHRDAVCHRISGCVCPSGRTGNDCKQVCAAGFYGIGCTLSCSDSCSNGTCNPETGHCVCSVGQAWNGTTCGNTPESPIVIGASDRGEKTGKEGTGSATWIGGAVGGACLFFIVLVAIVLVFRKKRNRGTTDITVDDRVTVLDNGCEQETLPSRVSQTSARRSRSGNDLPPIDHSYDPRREMERKLPIVENKNNYGSQARTFANHRNEDFESDRLDKECPGGDRDH